jgi:hypothetical protein
MVMSLAPVVSYSSKLQDRKQQFDEFYQSINQKTT